MFQAMKANSNNKRIQTFICEICIKPTSNRFRNADKCSHPFCKDCIVSYIRVNLDDNNVGHIKCPALNCDHMLEPSDCALFIDPKLLVRWMDVLCEEAIASQESCYCPNRSCNVLILNEYDEDPKKSKCPKCKRWFCFHCKSVWHAGFTCNESNGYRDRYDVAFGLIAESKNWKRCPQCRHFVERTEGCRNIKCRCGIVFCYKCGDKKKQHVLCSCYCYKCGDKKKHVLCSCYGTSQFHRSDYICLGLFALGVLMISVICGVLVFLSAE